MLIFFGCIYFAGVVFVFVCLGGCAQPKPSSPRTGLAERARDLGRRERAAAVGVKLRKAALHVEEEGVQALKLGERELARAARVKRSAFFVWFWFVWALG